MEFTSNLAHFPVKTSAFLKVGDFLLILPFCLICGGVAASGESRFKLKQIQIWEEGAFIARLPESLLDVHLSDMFPKKKRREVKFKLSCQTRDFFLGFFLGRRKEG